MAGDTMKSASGLVLLLLTATIGAAIGASAPTTGARAGTAMTIAGSKHDLSTVGSSPNVCVYCHISHSAVPDGPPLWNRASNSPGAYTMYASDTMDMAISPGPQEASLVCLSCHDGTIAIDDFGGATGGRNFITGSAKVGRDLTDDHPISVTYEPSRDMGNFVSLASVKQAGLRFYGPNQDQLECGTCHDPHETSKSPYFLRMANDGSAMCLTCHDK